MRLQDQSPALSLAENIHQQHQDPKDPWPFMLIERMVEQGQVY